MGSAENRAMHVLPPRGGQMGQYSTSNSAATQDLRLIGPQTQGADSAPLRGDPGAVGKYITVAAITADVYVAFASTSAAVGSITATTTGTNQTNTGFIIPAGTSRDFDLEYVPQNSVGIAASGDLFMGYVTASGTGYVQVYISSQR